MGLASFNRGRKKEELRKAIAKAEKARIKAELKATEKKEKPTK